MASLNWVPAPAPRPCPLQARCRVRRWVIWHAGFYIVAKCKATHGSFKVVATLRKAPAPDVASVKRPSEQHGAANTTCAIGRPGAAATFAARSWAVKSVALEPGTQRHVGVRRSAGVVPWAEGMLQHRSIFTAHRYFESKGRYYPFKHCMAWAWFW